MKTEEEIDRYIRCMEKTWEETSSTFTEARCKAAIATAKWVLGKTLDPPGYAELLALDKADDKRMDRT